MKPGGFNTIFFAFYIYFKKKTNLWVQFLKHSNMKLLLLLPRYFVMETTSL